jgi:hypothetical protein
VVIKLRFLPAILAPRIAGTAVASGIRCRTSQPPSFPAVTWLAALRGQHVLAVVDADNIDFSLCRAGLALRYGLLLKRMRVQARTIFPIAVLTAPAGDQRRKRVLAEGGWRTVSFTHEQVLTAHGSRKKANADLDICFEVGHWLGLCDSTALFILSGDGDLTTSIARGVRRSQRQSALGIHALSVPGSSSQRLLRHPELFDSAQLVGLDILQGRHGDATGRETALVVTPRSTKVLGGGHDLLEKAIRDR